VALMLVVDGEESGFDAPGRMSGQAPFLRGHQPALPQRSRICSRATPPPPPAVAPCVPSDGREPSASWPKHGTIDCVSRSSSRQVAQPVTGISRITSDSVGDDNDGHGAVGMVAT